MFLAQNYQLGLAPEARPQGCGFTADLTTALTAPRKPQIYFAIKLILKEMLYGLGLRAVTIAVPPTIADATNGNLAFHRHHVPFAGIRAVYAYFWDKHTFTVQQCRPDCLSFAKEAEIASRTTRIEPAAAAVTHSGTKSQNQNESRQTTSPMEKFTGLLKFGPSKTKV